MGNGEPQATRDGIENDALQRNLGGFLRKAMAVRSKISSDNTAVETRTEPIKPHCDGAGCGMEGRFHLQPPPSGRG